MALQLSTGTLLNEQMLETSSLNHVKTAFQSLREEEVLAKGKVCGFWLVQPRPMRYSYDVRIRTLTALTNAKEHVFGTPTVASFANAR